MIDRRRFLQSGVALSAVSAGSTAVARAAGAVTRTAAPGAPVLRPERLIVDRGLPEARLTARAARAAGIPIAVVDGDMSRLWYDEFDLQWRRKPMVLAGVTAPEGLFVLETLASDRGMRVVYRGDHRRSGAGLARHQLRGPATVLGPLAAGRAGTDFWGEEMVAALSRCGSTRAPVQTVDLAARVVGGRGDNRSGNPARNRRAERRPAIRNRAPAAPHIVSWLIAPRGTATPITAVAVNTV